MKNFFERIVRWYLCNCIYIYFISTVLTLIHLSTSFLDKEFIRILSYFFFMTTFLLSVISILHKNNIRDKKKSYDEYIISLKNNLDWIHRKIVLWLIPRIDYQNILFIFVFVIMFVGFILLLLLFQVFSLDSFFYDIIVVIFTVFLILLSNLFAIYISLVTFYEIIEPLLKIEESLTPHQSEEEARYEELRTRFAFHNITKDVRNLKSYITILKHEEPQLLAKFTTLDELTSMVEDTLNKFKNSDTIRTKNPFLIHELFDNFLILNKPDLVREGSDLQIEYEKIGYENMEIRQIFYEVYQVLNNLIDNSRKAIAQTERKEIQVYILVKSEGFVHFQVSDTGVGIDKKARDRVFDIGYSTTNGDGLGLLFVQTTLKRLGGEIQLLTNALSGFSTTFEVKIPV
jgi:signal transduction histidine kinase